MTGTIKEVKQYRAVLELDLKDLELLADAVGNAGYEDMQKDGHSMESVDKIHGVLSDLCRKMEAFK